MEENTLPTLKEIARRLRVSTSTVSRALHDHPSIGLVTTMRVKKIATELNYKPNSNAICFKQGKTFTIGVIVPSLSEAFFSLAVSGIVEYLSRENYRVIIRQSFDDFLIEKQVVETMKDQRVDGMIISISKNTSSYDHFEQLKQFNIPVVFFDRIPAMKNIHCVSCDIEAGMRRAIEEAVGKGHRRIALINGPSQLMASRERLKAYAKGLDENNIAFNQQLVVHTDLSARGNHAAMLQLLALTETPVAIIAFNDYVALDAMVVAKKRNLIVNRDICFASFGNLPLWDYMDNPPFASIEQFPYKQGNKAAEILFELLKMNPHSANIITGYSNIVLESHVVTTRN